MWAPKDCGCLCSFIHGIPLTNFKLVYSSIYKVFLNKSGVKRQHTWDYVVLLVLIPLFCFVFAKVKGRHERELVSAGLYAESRFSVTGARKANFKSVYQRLGSPWTKSRWNIIYVEAKVRLSSELGREGLCLSVVNLTPLQSGVLNRQQACVCST